MRKIHSKVSNTVELRNGGKFGHLEFFCYCGVFRYFAVPQIMSAENHYLKYLHFTDVNLDIIKVSIQHFLSRVIL